MNAMLEDAFNKLLDALDAAAPNKVLLAVDLRRALEALATDKDELRRAVEAK